MLSARLGVSAVQSPQSTAIEAVLSKVVVGVRVQRLTSDELLMTAVEDHPWQAFLSWCLGATTGLGNVDASIPWQKALTILLYGPEQAVHPKIRCQLRSHVCLHGKPITQRLARMIQITIPTVSGI
mgnify:CR=1 FL=1|jgi:hypothetical protein